MIQVKNLLKNSLLWNWHMYEDSIVDVFVFYDIV